MMRWSRKGRAVELLLTLFTYNPFVMSGEQDISSDPCFQILISLDMAALLGKLKT